MALQRGISRKLNRNWIGQELPVLIEGRSEESELLWQARTSTQAPEIDGVCYISDAGEIAPQQGQIRRLRVTAAHDYDLIGDLVDEAPVVAAPANPFRIVSASLVPSHERSSLPHR